MNTRSLWIFSVFFMILCPALVHAQSLNEFDRIHPDSLATWDRFGTHMVSNDDYIAISAPGMNRVDGGLGVVYLFDARNGEQVRIIEPVDPQEGEQFGHRLAMSEHYIAIGTQMFSEGEGRVLSTISIFDPESGTLVRNIHPKDVQLNGDYYSVALSDDRLAIGLPHNSDLGRNSGAVYLYDTNTGSLLHTIYPSEPHTEDFFGLSVEIHEQTLAIFSPYGSGLRRYSAVYLYDIANGEELSVIPQVEGDFRKTADWMAINRDYVAMSSWSDRTAWLFDRATGNQVAELQTPDGFDEDSYEKIDLFGYSVTLNESFAFVSAPMDSQNGMWAGAAYLFDLSTMTQVAKILPQGGVSNWFFGHPGVFNNEDVIVSETHNNESGSRSGAAYRFDTSSIHLCSPDFDDNGVLNFLDIQMFIELFTSNEPSADFDVDGIWNFFDVSEFIQELRAGCP